MNAEGNHQMMLDQADKLFAAHPGIEGRVDFPAGAPLSAGYFVADERDEDERDEDERDEDERDKGE